MVAKKNIEDKPVNRGKGKKSRIKSPSNPAPSISQQIKKPTEIKQTSLERLKSSAPYCALLTIIFAVALYIRAVLPHNSVFLSDGTIRFGGNDPWHYLRLLDYLLHNYPQTLFYDAYTNFPYGSIIHYGPLYQQLIALTSIILGLGHPSPHLLATVAAYAPALLGSLAVLPVYFIGKHLHNRGTGLLAALIIATLPGQFLSRSLLGFNDHHAAEALFSTAMILFFILALKSARAQNLVFKDLNRDWRAVKYPVIYAALAGVAYAAYQLCWPGAPMFGAIVVIAAIITYVAEHIRGNSTEYITIVGVLAFGIELLLILPWIHTDMGFNHGYYTWFHVFVSLAAIAALVTMQAVSKEMNRRDMNPYYYPASIVVIAAVGLGLVSIVLPTLFATIVVLPASVFAVKTGGAATVAEASSMLMRGTPPQLDIGRNSMVYSNFGNCFYGALFGVLVLGYYVVKRWKPEEILALVWTLVMLIAIYGQNRFGYYYAVNAALLSAYFGTKIIEFSGFKGIHTTIDELPRYLAKNAGYILLAILLVAVLVYPWGPAPLALKQAKYPGGPPAPWYNSLEWMRDNTPDPAPDPAVFSYYGPYVRPPRGEPYPYPDTAYGVMSWWDYGFWIETIGHRIPNANPFQSGIGGGEEQRPGAATFFTAESEAEANEIADTLGVKYVVSDVEMATVKFHAIAAWDCDTGGYGDWLPLPAQIPIGDKREMVPTSLCFPSTIWQGQTFYQVPLMRYFNSMEGRLHIFDGVSLKHYRLVHESTAAGGRIGFSELGHKWTYNMQPALYPDLFENRHQDMPSEIPEANTGYVKIFEYVPGAKLTGTAPPNSTVTLSIPILTNLEILPNQKRAFEYVQTATATPNGTFTLIAPYSTDGPIAPADGGTLFDTAPSDMYTVTTAMGSYPVSVSEADVLAGNVIEVT